MKSSFTFVLFTWCVLPVIALDDASSLRGIDSFERLLQGNGNIPCNGLSCTAKLSGNPNDEDAMYKEIGSARRCCSDEECQPDGEETTPGSDIYIGRCVPKRCVGQANDNGKDRGTHRVTICHRTCSEKNPWIRVTIDKSAFNETGCGHALHNVNETCTGKNISKWGGFNKDYVIRDHGSKNTLAQDMKWPNCEDGKCEEDKAYWKKWERACPSVNNGICCNKTAGECCGIPKKFSPNIILDKTVHHGILETCNSSTPDIEEITVEIADPLTFCYKICNNGDTELCDFQLYDNTNDFTWNSAVNLCLAPGICTYADPNPWAFCLDQINEPANVTAYSTETYSQVTDEDNAIVNVKPCKEKPQTTRNVGIKSVCKNPRKNWPQVETDGPVRPTICYPKSNYIFPAKALS